MSPSLGNPQLAGMGRMTADMPPFQAQDIRDLARRQVDSAMEQIRSANSLIDSLATQFPAAAEESKAVKKAMTQLMIKIVGSQSQPESPAPTGVMG
jgi:hypothetical protein